MKNILIVGLIACFIVIGSVGAEKMNNYVSSQGNTTNTTPKSNINPNQPHNSSYEGTPATNENNQKGDNNMEKTSTETNQEESSTPSTTEDGTPISNPSPTAKGSNPDHPKSVNTDGYGLTGS